MLNIALRYIGILERVNIPPVFAMWNNIDFVEKNIRINSAALKISLTVKPWNINNPRDRTGKSKKQNIFTIFCLIEHGFAYKETYKIAISNNPNSPFAANAAPQERNAPYNKYTFSDLK